MTGSAPSARSVPVLAAERVVPTTSWPRTTSCGDGEEPGLAQELRAAADLRHLQLRPAPTRRRRDSLRSVMGPVHRGGLDTVELQARGCCRRGLSPLGDGWPDRQGEGFQLWLVKGVGVSKAADCDVRTAERLVQVFGERSRTG
jgi:hypothetical protein